MKKVCIITTVHPLFDTRIFYKEAKTLVKAGYDVTLLVQHDRDEIIDHVRIIALDVPKNRLSRFVLSGRKAFRSALMQKADVYHFHDPELLPWMVYLKKITGAKMIYDIHENVSKDILSKEWIPFFFRRIISTIFGIYEKMAAAKIDYLIAATDDIAKSFKNKNIIVINNYPVIFEDQGCGHKKKGLTSNMLIYVGGLERIRGIKQIVSALGFIDRKYDARLTLVGAFSDGDFEKEIKSMPEWKSVDYQGYLPQKEAYAQMRNATLGLVCFLPEPNHINAMPNKMFEYMSAGIPIIASDFPLWKELVLGNGCGLTVNPLEPKEIAKAIENICEHRDEAKKMEESGRRAVLEKYNWKNESENLLKTYSELTNGN